MAANAAAAATGVASDAQVIGPGHDVADVYGNWAAVRETGESGCLLVRPDMVVCFRHMTAAADAHELLAAAMRQVLGRPLP